MIYILRSINAFISFNMRRTAVEFKEGAPIKVHGYPMGRFILDYITVLQDEIVSTLYVYDKVLNETIQVTPDVITPNGDFIVGDIVKPKAIGERYEVLKPYVVAKVYDFTLDIKDSRGEIISYSPALLTNLTKKTNLINNNYSESFKINW